VFPPSGCDLRNCGANASQWEWQTSRVGHSQLTGQFAVGYGLAKQCLANQYWQGLTSVLMKGSLTADELGHCAWRFHARLLLDESTESRWIKSKIDDNNFQFVTLQTGMERSLF
jgi:hypothetical protein